MSPTTISFILIGAMLVAVFFKIYISVAMSVIGLIGIAILQNTNAALMEAGMEPFAQVSAYTFTCVPLFILMGGVIANTGLGSDLFDFAAKFIGHVRGGLAMASVVACGIFAAVSGSSIATAVTMGKMAYPEMKRYNYDTKLSTATLAASGTIGFMIPPSITFISYGLITENSIGRLFMAGLLPGILNVIIFCFMVWLMAVRHPTWGPAGPKYKWVERMATVKGTWPIVALMIIVLGGIYLGVCTSTEAASLGAGGSILIALVCGKLTWLKLKTSVLEAVSTAGMFVSMIVGSRIFMRFLTLSGVPVLIKDTVTSLNINRMWVLFVVIIVYLILGAIFDVMSAVTLTLPIMYPIMTGLGFHPIWFGVLMTKLIMIGQYTPPIGMNVFVTAGALDVPSETIFGGVMPFFIADLVQLAILVIFPTFPLILGGSAL